MNTYESSVPFVLCPGSCVLCHVSCWISTGFLLDSYCGTHKRVLGDPMDTVGVLKVCSGVPWGSHLDPSLNLCVLIRFDK